MTISREAQQIGKLVIDRSCNYQHPSCAILRMIRKIVVLMMEKYHLKFLLSFNVIVVNNLAPASIEASKPEENHGFE